MPHELQKVTLTWFPCGTYAGVYQPINLPLPKIRSPPVSPYQYIMLLSLLGGQPFSMNGTFHGLIECKSIQISYVSNNNYSGNLKKNP